jgi:hypothetical protein
MTPCGVDRKRSFDQRLMMLPRLIRKVSGTIGEGKRHGKGWEHPVADRAQRVEIGHHVGTQAGQPRRPLIATAQRLPGDHVGMVRSAIMGDKKLSF